MLLVLFRAYKLGKGRWSYNKCSLMLRQHQLDGQGESKQLTVSKAAVDEQSISQQDGQVGALAMFPPGIN